MHRDRLAIAVPDRWFSAGRISAHSELSFRAAQPVSSPAPGGLRNCRCCRVGLHNRGFAHQCIPDVFSASFRKRLEMRGYESMFMWYQKVIPHKFMPTLFPVV